MANGAWRMVYGEWRMAYGAWCTVYGVRCAANCVPYTVYCILYVCLIRHTAQCMLHLICHRCHTVHQNVRSANYTPRYGFNTSRQTVLMTALALSLPRGIPGTSGTRGLQNKGVFDCHDRADKRFCAGVLEPIV